MRCNSRELSTRLNLDNGNVATKWNYSLTSERYPASPGVKGKGQRSRKESAIYKNVKAVLIIYVFIYYFNSFTYQFVE
jgi:hypothetical protein